MRGVSIITYHLCYLLGIKDCLNYIEKDTRSKILYLNSIYESDDGEHGTTLVDHKKIASVLGTEKDFEELRKETKKMESM